ncbi:MAG TPA: transglutaminase domain-containing protein, partial [Bacteroidia bacterium]|nr:transglutaminase domain-containing protein [Bacteroidia bacterium]
RSRKGVCDDFADLFKAMAEKAGLAAEKIGGWSKGYGYMAGTKFGQPDHAWNAVFIDDEWHLLDVTWAEGFGETKNGKLKTTKKFKGGWFDTAPAEFVFKHLPSDPKWQLLEKPLTLAEYENLPVAGPELFALGYDSARLLAEARSGKSVEFPMVFDHPFAIKAVSAPYQKAFSLGSPLKLQFECRDCAAMAAFSDGIITDFDKKGKAFSLTFRPSPGPLRIFAKKNKNDRRFQGVMEFDIL